MTLGGERAHANNPIVIKTAEELDSIRIDLTGDYVLGADIDLDIAPYNVGAGWTPISKFNGSFDGKGHTISGLKINKNQDRAGLFGDVGGKAKITNVNLKGVDITAGHNIGALVGHMGNGGLIENVTVTGKITGADVVGGIAGYLSNAKIKNSHANVTVYSKARAGGLVSSAGGDDSLIEGSTSAGVVESSGSMVGGLAAEATNVKNSYSSAKVISTNAAEYNNVGGLIGYVRPFKGEIINSFATGDVEAISNNVGGLIGSLSVNGTSVTVTNSYATGTVTGKDYVGGLVGNYHTSSGNYNQLLIKDSYATGNVFGENKVVGLIGVQDGLNARLQKSFATGNVNATGDDAGGLVGQLLTQTTIIDAYARGNVKGENNVGGFVGENVASTIQNGYAVGKVDGVGNNVGGFAGGDQRGDNTANFYDAQTTGQSHSTGATPKSTVEMKTQATFKGWNFTSTWSLEKDDYPTFRDAPLIQFNDVSGHWAADQINEAVERGYFTGYEDETFKPNDPITRAEFAVIINRAINLDASESVPSQLMDISNHWAKEAIEKTQKAGIVSGYDDGTFRPNNKVSRAEIAAMVSRALQLDPIVNESTGFTDEGQIPNWAKGYVVVMKEYGIITGREGNKFAPAANITRAEAAVILLRSVDN